AEIFAIAGCILPDERDLAHTLLRQTLRFGNDRFEPPRTKLPPQLRNDAERAGMIAALRNLDVSRILRCREQAGRVFVVKVIRKIGDCAVPRFLREPANGFASVTLGSSVQNDERRNQGLWWRYSGGGE